MTTRMFKWQVKARTLPLTVRYLEGSKSVSGQWKKIQLAETSQEMEATRKILAPRENWWTNNKKIP
jgi:hypothetical protein